VRRVEKDERRDQVQGVSRQQRDDDVPAPCKKASEEEKLEAVRKLCAPEGRVGKDVADGELSSTRLDRVLGIHDAVVRDHSRGHLRRETASVREGRTRRARLLQQLRKTTLAWHTHEHVDHDQGERDDDDEVEAVTSLRTIAEGEDEAADCGKAKSAFQILDRMIASRLRKRAT
jgi:hypothetical protein